MKKFILLFLVIMCSFYFVIDGYVMEAHATEEIDSVYEQPEHSELIHYSDELAEDYVLFFTYNDEEYTFSLLDYYFCNNKNNKYSGIADVYTNFNNSNKEFFVAKLSYISTGINRYIIKCHVYLPNINKMVYFQVLTNYYLSEILEFYETYDYNDIVMKNASVFNYCKSQLATSKTRSVSNVESVIAEYSKETFLSTSEFLYEYIPLHSDSTSGIGGYVGDDSIVNVIPKEYFLTSGVKFKYGREWGFYLNVESISSDQKECSLITFQIKMEKPTNQSYISIEFFFGNNGDYSSMCCFGLVFTGNKSGTKNIPLMFYDESSVITSTYLQYGGVYINEGLTKTLSLKSGNAIYKYEITNMDTMCPKSFTNKEDDSYTFGYYNVRTYIGSKTYSIEPITLRELIIK